MENKLIMSQKEECNSYNLIIENINKLVDMCGNTKEAIELRDNLFNLFTTKYSEPLYNILGLQEKVGCPLEVIFKALKDGFYDEYGALYKADEFYLDYNWLLSNPSDKYLTFNVEDTYFEFKLIDYKNTWWLREDKSE